ncbi:MAG TPA: hypothetical protein GX497_07030 [Bacillus bacterium]|nr:hypothetical protein [Bacillus sp. (in: firmicutes)]
MGSFFEFIFGNIGFLIVIIGAIASFLKRANENQKQSQKQSSRDKRVKPFIPSLGDLLEEINKPQEEQKQKPTMYTATKRVPQIEQTVEEEVRLEAPPIEMTPNPYLGKLRELEKKKQHINVDAGMIYSKINKKEVINGIIWGEILGPPRAKKKHSYSNLKRG